MDEHAVIKGVNGSEIAGKLQGEGNVGPQSGELEVMDPRFLHDVRDEDDSLPPGTGVPCAILRVVALRPALLLVLLPFVEHTCSHSLLHLQRFPTQKFMPIIPPDVL